MKQGQIRVRYVRPHRDAYERLRDCTPRAIDAGECALHIVKERHAGPVEEEVLATEVAVFIGTRDARPSERTMRELTRRGVFIAHATAPLQGKRALCAPIMRAIVTRGVLR